ncbi:hypothetical protein Glove_140g101 [Diversispora epigaea]|uniref:Uncharacterized protein n=1 Tax=Diversispora epigaea TaxID=1348612 RepID=A0A397IZ79_9GLOM|nr:hypothetical protein Glove_140g101 [Diversispora epigaea]
MSSLKLIKPIRLFFLTSPRTITTLEESQAIFSFFNSKGELSEFKLHREPYDKKTCRYGWASYKDNEIAKSLAGEIYSLPIKYSVEIKIKESEDDNEIRKQLPLSRRQPRFNGFYIKPDEPLISKRITTEQRTDSSEKINTTIKESIKEFPITEPINSVDTVKTNKDNKDNEGTADSITRSSELKDLNNENKNLKELRRIFAIRDSVNKGKNVIEDQIK